MNTDAPWPSPEEAAARVLGIQVKLHQWATDSPDRRFDDLFNLVCDPAFLVVAWNRVRGNRGHARLGSMGCNRARSSSATCSCSGCEMISRPAGSSRFPCGNG